MQTNQKPYQGAEVLVFTRGSRGYMATIQTIWANGDVTLLPASRTIPSLIVKGSDLKWGTKLAQVHAGLGKVVFSYRRPIRVGDRVRIKRGMVGEGYIFTVARVDWSEFEGQNVVAGHNYGPVRASEVEVF